MTRFEVRLLEILTQIQANTRRSPPGVAAPSPTVEPDLAFIQMYKLLDRVARSFVEEPSEDSVDLLRIDIKDMVLQYMQRFDAELVLWMKKYGAVK